jgi:D-xylose 1-dehydrogenase (NADP+, D-xylono-1,5-lactone-forming)
VTVRWGLLSTARINDKFLAGVAESTDSSVLAIASRDGRRAESYARERGIDRFYGSYEALLADPDVDALYISLPNSLHLEWTRRALEAGKHVLCEKPLSRRVGDVEAIFDLAERHGRLVMEAFMYRHHPQTTRLVELVGSGAIGRLQLVRASFSFPLHDPADVRLSAELDGGALMDVGCYCVNAARLLAGEPRVAGGWRVDGGDGVDVAFVGTLRFDGDVLAHFDAGLVFDARYDLEVVGDEGRLVVADPWHCLTPGIGAQARELCGAGGDPEDQPLRAGGGQPGGGDPRRRGTPAGARRRHRAGAHDRGAVRLGPDGPLGAAGVMRPDRRPGNANELDGVIRRPEQDRRRDPATCTRSTG